MTIERGRMTEDGPLLAPPGTMRLLSDFSGTITGTFYPWTARMWAHYFPDPVARPARLSAMHREYHRRQRRRR